MLEQSILESAGYEVELAVSAEEALEKARRRRYALFLVDVEMPGMDGFAFIERDSGRPRSARHPGDPRHLARGAGGPPARRRRRRAGLHRQERVRSGRAPGADPAADRLGDGQDPRPGRRRFADGAQAAGARCWRRDPEIEVVGEADDGKEAIELCQEAAAGRRHDGHDAAGDERPRGDRVHHGALPDADPHRVVVDQPRRTVQDLRGARGRRRRRARKADRATSPTACGSARFVAQVKLVSRIRVITHPRAAAGGPGPAVARAGSARSAAATGNMPPSLAIGASTGGPAAIVEVLRGLPAAFPHAHPHRAAHRRALRRPRSPTGSTARRAGASLYAA